MSEDGEGEDLGTSTSKVLDGSNVQYFRNVIRALVKQLAENRKQEQAGKVDREEHAKRIRVLHRALAEAQKERAALKKMLLVAKTNLAAAEVKQFDSEQTQRRAQGLEKELDSARRRLARAEDLAQRLNELEAQFSWELVEEIDNVDDVDLSRDDIVANGRRGSAAD